MHSLSYSAQSKRLALCACITAKFALCAHTKFPDTPSQMSLGSTADFAKRTGRQTQTESQPRGARARSDNPASVINPLRQGLHQVAICRKHFLGHILHYSYAFCTASLVGTIRTPATPRPPCLQLHILASPFMAGPVPHGFAGLDKQGSQRVCNGPSACSFVCIPMVRRQNIDALRSKASTLILARMCLL